jgi:hypothetical protein
MNPYIIIAALVGLALVSVGSFGYGEHIETLLFDEYKSQQAAAAQKQVADNKTALLAQAQAEQAKMDQINLTHAGETDEIVKRRDALLAANRDLTQRLWVRTASAGKPATVVPGAAASEPVDAGAGETALSPAVGSWLTDQFTQADTDIATIAALQQVVIQDRAVCNGALPGLPEAK